MIGNEDTGVLAEGTTPHIDQKTGNWFIGTHNTGVHAQGAPGKDAYQPFKGTFASVQDLNDAYPEPNDGDTAYVEDTVENTTILNVYDVVNDEWHDTGTTADSPVFGSGQFLNSVKIDDTHLANPAYGSLPKAEDVINQGRSLNDKINEVPYNLNKEEYTDIDLSQYPDITTATIIRSTNVWGDSYAYNAFKLIPVFPGAIFEVKANGERYAQITFLKSDAVEIDQTPDYAGDINELSLVAPNTAERFIAPDDAVFMYVLIQQADDATYWRTPEYVRLIQPAYIQQSKIIDNFDSTDKTTVLSGALGPVLKPSVEAGKPINRISPLGGQKIQGANLNYLTGNWSVETGRSCTFVDIQGLGIKKIQVVSGDHSVHFGFVSDFTVPDNGVEGLENKTASLIGSIITLLGVNLSVDVDVPPQSKFIYFNISGRKQNNGSRQSYVPKEVNILEQESNIEPIIPSWDNNYDYETYVEENYYDEYKPQAYLKQKFYKIDHNAVYKLLLYGEQIYNTSLYGITTYDSSNTQKRQLYPWGGGSNGQGQDVNMGELEFSEDETYVMLTYYHYQAEGAYGPNAKGAIMRKLKNDNWVPTNNLIYCVSKIKSPVMPYNYQEADTVFPQTDEWSAWDFVMPYNYNRVLFTNKKFPICTFFHGSSGYDTPDNMGYSSSEQIMSSSNGKTIVGMLREAGYVVFDINGYGISRNSDSKSRHWGNPRAVATVKKAYEVLVDRFNCRRGMAISGISMGCALAKSYCMTYPGDVVCAALEAPSELGGTCRFSVSGDNSTTSAAEAWGYENANAMYADNEHTAFIGYSPCIAPNVIDGNGFIKKIVQTDWNEQSDIFSNLSNFSCNFPVEIKIWHGDADDNVPLEYSQWFVNTVRNANGNATLRICPNCEHELNHYPWVRQEIVNYIDSKMKI